MLTRGLPFAAVRDASIAVLPSLLRRWLPDGKVRGREFVAKNPTRVDKRAGSFQINLRTGRWIDFATSDKGGDPVSLYAYLAGLSQGEACRELAAELGIDASRAPARRTFARAEPPAEADRLEADTDRSARRFARQLWVEAGPAAGTPVEAYLRRRGLTIPVPKTLRLARLKHPQTQDPKWRQRHPGLAADVRWPVMLGAMQVGGELTGVHRTFLVEDGQKAPVDPVKMMLGAAWGACVRLAPLGPALIIGEGIETSLSALQLCPGWTVWAALSAGNLSRIAIPPEVRRLVIVADPDAKPDPRIRPTRGADPRALRRVGLLEAEKAIAPLRGLGIAAEIVKLPNNRDLNDVLQDDPAVARRFAEAMAARLRELVA